MDGRFYCLTAMLLWSGLAIRIPRLLHSRRDPAPVSLCAVLLAAGISFTLSAPAGVAAVNHPTGIPDIAAPPAYTVVTAFSASCIVLTVHWRGGEPAHVRRAALAWLTAYAAVTVALWVLFAIGDAPLERRADLDTYYATTPGLAEMITLLNGVFGMVELAAVVARWTGRRRDTLSTDLAPAVALVTFGHALPPAGPRIESVTAYAGLRPLFKLLVDPADRRCRVPLSWRSLGDIDLRLTRRETGIRDGISPLRPGLDDRVRERAYNGAISCGASTPEAEAIGAAAMAVAATRTGSPGEPVPGARVPTALDGNLRDLVRVSRAVHTPIVADTPRAGGRPENRGT
ncbi:DUF6545 domain-containing protein [Streptomyces sp. NPDC046931]|uniref:DUF6545 domain-containing protein n=1 Tax=Streptomyces sp. NPDC046931 TaxID=3154806 RepID=UPI0033E4D69E